MKWFDSITDSMHMNLSKLWEILEDRGACYATVHGITELNTHNLATEQQKQQQHDLNVCWGNNELRMNWHVKVLLHHLNRRLELQLQHSLEPDYFLIMYHGWSQINK